MQCQLLSGLASSIQREDLTRPGQHKHTAATRTHCSEHSPVRTIKRHHSASKDTHTADDTSLQGPHACVIEHTTLPRGYRLCAARSRHERAHARRPSALSPCRMATTRRPSPLRMQPTRHPPLAAAERGRRRRASAPRGLADARLRRVRGGRRLRLRQDEPRVGRRHHLDRRGGAHRLRRAGHLRLLLRVRLRVPLGGGGGGGEMPKTPAMASPCALRTAAK
mmetsp:Transcript_37658/g.86153  ORF Transcript_37658/g.86153 Transcript_37658/m.86153 type:complete len:222 (-) Transcript_37658:682-1347(-)